MTREELKDYHEIEGYNCVILVDNDIYMTSFEKGVAPLYNLILQTEQLPEGKIEMADKIVGRAVAFLAIQLKVSYLYTKVISETALEVLNQTNMTVVYDEVVPYIYNRNKDGQCPMEKALEDVYQSTVAWEVIHAFKSDQQK